MAAAWVTTGVGFLLQGARQLGLVKDELNEAQTAFKESALIYTNRDEFPVSDRKDFLSNINTILSVSSNPYRYLVETGETTLKALKVDLFAKYFLARYEKISKEIDETDLTYDDILKASLAELSEQDAEPSKQFVFLRVHEEVKKRLKKEECEKDVYQHLYTLRSGCEPSPFETFSGIAANLQEEAITDADINDPNDVAYVPKLAAFIDKMIELQTKRNKKKLILNQVRIFTYKTLEHGSTEKKIQYFSCCIINLVNERSATEGLPQTVDEAVIAAVQQVPRFFTENEEYFKLNQVPIPRHGIVPIH